MEVTALCFTLLMLKFTLLNTQKSVASSLHIAPNRLQHFEYESVSFNCAGMSDPTRLRGVRNTQEFISVCHIKRTPTGSSCTAKNIYPEDSGEYWCETEGGERSNSVNISVTAGSVILESPVLPVEEGDDVTLTCRNKMSSSHPTAGFYKDGVLIRSSSTGEMTIHSVSKSDEGLYKCHISGAGESPESWMAVRAHHRETYLFSDLFIHVVLVLRTVFTIVMVPLLLLLVGLLHCGKLTVTVAQT